MSWTQTLRWFARVPQFVQQNSRLESAVNSQLIGDRVPCCDRGEGSRWLGLPHIPRRRGGAPGNLNGTNRLDSMWQRDQRPV